MTFDPIRSEHGLRIVIFYKEHKKHCGIMRYRNIFHILFCIILCSMIGSVCGQDWLEGGYVGSYYGDIGMYFTDPIFYVNPHAGQSYYGFYPGPYGVYPFYSSPYYSDFRLNSLAGLNWTRFQKNWSKTMEFAQTRSSFRTYPISSSPYPVVQFPASISTTTSPVTPTSADSTATIVSQSMRGYQVFLDGNYIGTEGTGGDPLDGTYTFKLVGGQSYNIRVFDGQFNYPKTMFFERGGTKIIHVEPGTAVYV